MLVKTPPGIRCPREDNPRQYITDIPEEVPATTYYRRLVMDGSLIAVIPAPPDSMKNKPEPPAIKKKKLVPGPESPVPVATERSDT